MTASRFVFVTTRIDKLREAEALGFSLERRDLDLVEPQAVDPRVIAKAKAESAFAVLKRPVVVDDSGLEILAWGGFPGALVKWLVTSAGVGTITRMLEPFSDRRARAVCALACYDGERLLEATGVTDGSITTAPRGAGGFGWDPIFVPAGSARTFAEMELDEKGRISHRGRAWRELARILADPSG